MIKTQIELVSTKSQIPNLLFLEANIPEGEAWCYLNDSDSVIYIYIMDYGEIITTTCPEGIKLSKLIEIIELEIIDNAGSRDITYANSNELA